MRERRDMCVCVRQKLCSPGSGGIGVGLRLGLRGAPYTPGHENGKLRPPAPPLGSAPGFRPLVPPPRRYRRCLRQRPSPADTPTIRFLAQRTNADAPLTQTPLADTTPRKHAPLDWAD
jgi:hypothetical protein